MLGAVIVAGAFFWFLYANVIQSVQENVNPQLGESEWATETHYAFFALANNFLTSFWTYLFALVVSVVAFWVYIYNQRRGAGYQ